MAKTKTFTQDEVIAKFKRIHGDTYDYSEVEYENHITKVRIICKQHGPFMQQPRLHLRGSTGCKTCIALNKKYGSL